MGIGLSERKAGAQGDMETEGVERTVVRTLNFAAESQNSWAEMGIHLVSVTASQIWRKA